MDHNDAPRASRFFARIFGNVPFQTDVVIDRIAGWHGGGKANQKVASLVRSWLTRHLEFSWLPAKSRKAFVGVVVCVGVKCQCVVRGKCVTWYGHRWRGWFLREH